MKVQFTAVIERRGEDETVIRFGKGLCGAESFIDHLKERAIATGFKVVKL